MIYVTPPLCDLENVERDSELQKLISASVLMASGLARQTVTDWALFLFMTEKVIGQENPGPGVEKHFKRKRKQNVAREGRTKEVASFIQLKSWLPFCFPFHG